MHYGVQAPNSGAYGNPRLIAELAHVAEQSGWDGFFIWDGIASGPNKRAIVDPWIALTAAAMSTERIRLGTMVTAVASRHPWKLARETVSLDQLTGGRVTLGVGLGHPDAWEYERFGEEADLRTRARKLDEGLDVLVGLWSGQLFHHQGIFYQVQETAFVPPPVQSPRIPIWVGGGWPNKAPMRRAARWDGAFPVKLGNGTGPSMLTPDEVRAIGAYIAQHRPGTSPFDLIINGQTLGDDGAAGSDFIAPYVEAGLTWWLEEPDLSRDTVEDMRLRIRQGPPAT